MKALVYKLFLDNKWGILISSVVLSYLYYAGVNNFSSGFIWLIIYTTARPDTKETWAYFRTMNFTREEFFKSRLIYTSVVLLIRLSIMVVFSLVITKPLSELIYFISFIYVFLLIENTVLFDSTEISGEYKEDGFVLVIKIMIFLIAVMLAFAFLNQFYWPMEKLVYGSSVLTAVVIIYSLCKYHFYKGVHYAKDKKY